MAANSLVALGVNAAPVDAMASYGQGVNASQTQQSNKLALAQKGMTMIGSLALGVMDGKLDGKADPQRWDQALNLLQQQGVNVDAFRGKPEMASTVARASMDTLNQLKLALDDKQVEAKLQQFASAITKTGLTVIPATNDAGEYTPGLADQAGHINPAKMPDGFHPLDPRTLYRERAAGGVEGKVGAQAGADLPNVIAQGQQNIDALKGLLPAFDANGKAVEGSNPGFDEQFATGPFGIPYGQMTGAIANTPKATYQTKLDQVHGEAFLQAFNTLRGAGAISEIEGQKASQAIIRASTSQKKEDYVAAIKEAIGIYEKGVDRARQKAARGQTVITDSQQPGGPAPSADAATDANTGVVDWTDPSLGWNQ